MKRLFHHWGVPVVLVWMLARCASIQMPTGGPKDKMPPQLVSSIPPSNQTGFRGVSVLLTFDELVKLNSPREEIIISPSPGKEIEFKVKNNRVFITPKEPWKGNTTYSILFRDGIQDVTESNSPVNLKLAFSTGDYIDSLSLSGNVTEILSGTPMEKVTVAIFSEDTFDIFSHTPIYFTKSSKEGNFRLDNIRGGRFHVYAFDDKNKNLKVESRNERFGFLKDPIDLNRNVDTLNLGLVQLDSRPLKFSSIRNTGTITRIRFPKGIQDYTITATPEPVSAYGDNTSEVNIWNPSGGDSIQVKFTATDSLNDKVDTSFYIKHLDARSLAERFQHSLGAPFINPENAKITSTFSFSKPIKDFVLDSLYIKVDTTSRIPISQVDLTYIPKSKQVMLSKDLDKKMFGPDVNPILVLMMKKGFALSIDGDTSKAISAPVTIFWPEENGVIMIQANTRVKNYILQLVEKSSMKVVAQAVNVPKLTAKNIEPADYFLRAIIDANGNGRWDPGNVHKLQEPERVIYYKAPDGSRAIPVRANWEIGPIEFSF